MTSIAGVPRSSASRVRASTTWCSPSISAAEIVCISGEARREEADQPLALVGTLDELVDLRAQELVGDVAQVGHRILGTVRRDAGAEARAACQSITVS